LRSQVRAIQSYNMTQPWTILPMFLFLIVCCCFNSFNGG